MHIFDMGAAAAMMQLEMEVAVVLMMRMSGQHNVQGEKED